MSQTIATAPLGHYRLKHVVRSEVAKIASLPSTAITLGLTVVAGLLVTDSIMAAVNQGGPGGTGPLSPAIGLLLMAVYAAIALTAGAVLFVKRDA
jgi:hypothetical protein